MPVGKHTVLWWGTVPQERCWIWVWDDRGVLFPFVLPTEPFCRVYEYADEMVHLVDVLICGQLTGQRWRVRELWEHLGRPPVMYFNVALDVTEEDGYADWTLEGVQFWAEKIST